MSVGAGLQRAGLQRVIVFDTGLVDFCLCLVECAKVLPLAVMVGR